jgi:hypothetical protein
MFFVSLWLAHCLYQRTQSTLPNTHGKVVVLLSSDVCQTACCTQGSEYLRWLQEKNHFCNRFLWAVHDSVLDPNLHISLTKLGSIWVNVPIPKTVGIGTVLMLDRLLKCPFTIRKLVCHYYYINSRTIFFKTLLFKSRKEIFWASIVIARLVSILFLSEMHRCVYNEWHINQDVRVSKDPVNGHLIN